MTGDERPLEVWNIDVGSGMENMIYFNGERLRGSKDAHLSLEAGEPPILHISHYIMEGEIRIWVEGIITEMRGPVNYTEWNANDYCPPFTESIQLDVTIPHRYNIVQGLGAIVNNRPMILHELEVQMERGGSWIDFSFNNPGSNRTYWIKMQVTRRLT